MVVLDNASRNAACEAVKTTIGASPKLQLRTGAQPAGLPSAAGTLLGEMTLPSTFWDTAGTGGAGLMQLVGTWQVNSVAAGTIGYGLLTSSGGTPRLMFTVSVTGGTGELRLNTLTVSGVGQQITVEAMDFQLGGGP